MAETHVLDLIKELDELLGMAEKYEQVLTIEEKQERMALAALDAQIAELLKKKEAIEAEAREANADIYDIKDQLKAEIAKAEESLRKTCQNLPLSMARDGATFEHGKLRVSVSRSTTKTTYRQDLLTDRPDFLERFVDGDPLVKTSIDATVLERLVANGTLTAAEVDPYKVEVRVRTPQVRIVAITE